MLLGCETPRIYTPPLRELTPETSYGFSVIEFAEEVLRIPLFPWQKWFYIHALECNPDGSFRFRVIVLLVARQNGKSLLAQILVLWGLLVLGVNLALGTAQSLDTSEETWEGAVSLVEGNDELAPLLDKVVRVNGKKEMLLDGGHRYKVAAASRRGGRGKTGDIVLMDELREHLNWEAWGAVTKTTNARPNALILCMSNAGDAYSVVLRHLRYRAHMALGDPDGWCASVGDSGDGGDGGDESAPADTLGLFEWSAPPGCSKWDRGGWAQSNPSMGHGTITERVIASDAATDKESVFRTEDLCQWVETIREEPFPEGAWAAGMDPRSRIAEGSPLAWGIDVSADRTKTSIAVAGYREDGCIHVEISARRQGNTWPLTWLAERAPKYGRMRVAWQKRGAPVSSMSDELSAIAGVEPHEVEGRDLASWCGRLWDGVASCLPDSDSDALRVYHVEQPALDMAAKTAATKPLGDSAWVFDRARSPEDCSPLMACAMAMGLLCEREQTKAVKSAYSEERGMISF